MKKIMICILLITSVLLVSCDRIERLTGHFNRYLRQVLIIQCGALLTPIYGLPLMLY